MVCKGCESMAVTYGRKVINVFFLSFVNSLSFHYKRHNQNKADSTLNKNRDLLNSFVQSWIHE